MMWWAVGAMGSAQSTEPPVYQAECWAILVDLPLHHLRPQTKGFGCWAVGPLGLVWQCFFRDFSGFVMWLVWSESFSCKSWEESINMNGFQPFDSCTTGGLGAGIDSVFTYPIRSAAEMVAASRLLLSASRRPAFRVPWNPWKISERERWHNLWHNGHQWTEWYWMILNDTEWYWMILNDTEWYWMILNNFHSNLNDSVCIGCPASVGLESSFRKCFVL